MRIGIDISQVVYGTGVSTYTRNLVKNLLLTDIKNEYFLFGGSARRTGDLKAFLKGLSGNFNSKLIPFPPTLADLIWNRLHILPIETLIGKVDVFHSSDWAQPPSSAFKVTTVHDLVPFKFPELSHPRIVSAHKSRLNWVKKEVDRVIVPSQATRGDLRQLDVDLKSKIVVIPEAPDPIFKPESKVKIDKIKRKYNIKRKYLLAVGITPRKNTNRIIKAYESINNSKLELVIIGHPFMEIEHRKRVIVPGEVPLKDLPSLYSGAELLIYPSLYEGYGLPILEAFATNTPVVTSNTGSLKEVAGKAAILVNPNSTESIKNGIIKALDESEKIVKKGVKRGKNFTWEKVAKKTLDVYKSTK